MQKVVLKGNILAKKHHVGIITCHLMIPRHFRSTTKVTSSVTKTPTSYTSQRKIARQQGSTNLL